MGGINLVGQRQLLSDNRFTINFGDNDNQSNSIFYWVNKKYDGTRDYGKYYEQITNRSTMIVKSGSATFQGVTHTIETKTADNDASMLLLASYSSAASKIVPFKRYDAKIYGFQIYEGNTLIKNLIPCYRNSDKIAGLYDLVNNIFYTSNGDSDFLY